MADAVAKDVRRAAVGKTLADNAALQVLTTSPYVVDAGYPSAMPDPAAFVVMRVTPGGTQTGWNGSVTERFAFDVFVDESAAADPTGRADAIAAAVEAALTPTALEAALVALGVTTATASAARVNAWGDLPEPDEPGQRQMQAQHLTADYDIAFLRLNEA